MYFDYRTIVSCCVFVCTFLFSERLIADSSEPDCRIIEYTNFGIPDVNNDCRGGINPNDWQSLVNSVFLEEALGPSESKVVSLVSDRLGVDQSFVVESIRASGRSHLDLEFIYDTLATNAIEMFDFVSLERTLAFESELKSLLPESLSDNVRQEIEFAIRNANSTDVEEAKEGIRTLFQLADVHELPTSFTMSVATRYSEKIQVDKAIYDTYDNFPAEQYKEIHEMARNTAAIGRTISGGIQIECSGVFLSQSSRVILTAAHCFKNNSPDRFGVYLSAKHKDKYHPVSEDNWTKHEIVKVVLANGEEHDMGETTASLDLRDGLEDFVLLEISPFTPNDFSPQGVCISNRAVVQDDQVLLFGFPRLSKEITVHDNSRVILPFELSGLSQRQAVEMEVKAEAAKFKEKFREDLQREYESPSTSPDRRADLEENREKYIVEKFSEHLNLLTEDFNRSYIQVANNKWRLYDHKKSNHAKIGVVTDAYGGDSGGGVYLRNGKNKCLIGILKGGLPPEGVRRTPGWTNNEHVTPVQKIVERLDEMSEQNKHTELIKDIWVCSNFDNDVCGYRYSSN